MILIILTIQIIYIDCNSSNKIFNKRGLTNFIRVDVSRRGLIKIMLILIISFGPVRVYMIWLYVQLCIRTFEGTYGRSSTG